jgi:uncharacterized protein (TIGR03032 family)
LSIAVEPALAKKPINHPEFFSIMATDDSSPAEKTENSENAQPAHGRRQVDYEFSREFLPIMQHIKSTLVVSTYAAGKLAVVSAINDQLDLKFNNFQQAMGVAVSPKYLAVGGQNLIWIMENGGSLSQQISQPGTNSVCYLTREAFVTGNIHCHEMGWGRDGELWVVNTLFSCLCTLHEEFNFVPRWKPKFISQYAAEDRCHLNGIAMHDGRPRFVSAMGQTDETQGWREKKATDGVIIDVESDEIVAHGLCMPHSPRWHQGKLYVLDSGKGRLVTVDLQSGKLQPIVEIPAYIRGLSFCGQFAIIGMSRARERSVFGGVPICEEDNRDKLRCGVVIVDLHSGTAVAFLQFKTGIEEIFDIQVLRDVGAATIVGPYPTEDEATPIWVIPRPDQVPNLLSRSQTARIARNRVH